MRSTIIALRRETAPLGPREDPIIGCRILTEPFFWPRDLWIPVPESFSPNIVVGKGNSANTEEGVRLWNAVSERFAATQCVRGREAVLRSEEHTSALQSLMRISYAVFCLKKKNTKTEL